MTHVDCLHPKTPLIDVKTGLPTKFFSRWLYCMWSRTGGDQDYIQDLQYTSDWDESSVDTNVINLDKKVDELKTELDIYPFADSRINTIENTIKELTRELDIAPLWTTNNFFTTKVFSTSSNFTTYDNCIVIATSNITVTLNANPKDQEKVVVKRATTAGEVTISSSNIDGATTYVLLVNYEAAQCVYSMADNEWFIV